MTSPHGIRASRHIPLACCHLISFWRHFTMKKSRMARPRDCMCRVASLATAITTRAHSRASQGNFQKHCATRKNHNAPAPCQKHLTGSKCTLLAGGGGAAHELFRAAVRLANRAHQTPVDSKGGAPPLHIRSLFIPRSLVVLEHICAQACRQRATTSSFV